MNRKCNCENKVSSQKLDILKNSIIWKSSSCENVYNWFEKSSDPLKVEALKRYFTQRVASSKSSSSKVLCLLTNFVWTSRMRLWAIINAQERTLKLKLHVN